MSQSPHPDARGPQSLYPWAEDSKRSSRLQRLFDRLSCKKAPTPTAAKPDRLAPIIASYRALQDAPDRWVLGPDGVEWDTAAFLGAITPDELRAQLWREELRGSEKPLCPQCSAPLLFDMDEASGDLYCEACGWTEP